MTPITKDNKQHEQFGTGAKRDTQQGKPRFDLIPVEILDLLQQSYGGYPLEIDNTQERFTGWIDEEETRPDLIPDIAINRLAGLMYRGAQKYAPRNWEAGMPISRVYASLYRHLIQWVAGDTSEDHMSAVLWNAAVIITYENDVAEGRLPESIEDMHRNTGA